MNEKQQEFAQKYEALCEEYGMRIFPQMQLVIGDVPKQEVKEEPKEETPA